jgi:hypothetical protein
VWGVIHYVDYVDLADVAAVWPDKFCRFVSYSDMKEAPRPNGWNGMFHDCDEEKTSDK